MTLRYDNDVGCWVSYDSVLDIYSQGRTRSEAVVALVSAVKLYCQSHIERLTKAAAQEME